MKLCQPRGCRIAVYVPSIKEEEQRRKVGELADRLRKQFELQRQVEIGADLLRSGADDRAILKHLVSYGWAQYLIGKAENV